MVMVYKLLGLMIDGVDNFYCPFCVGLSAPFIESEQKIGRKFFDQTCLYSQWCGTWVLS